jgi:hypothetical protein
VVRSIISRLPFHHIVVESCENFPCIFSVDVIVLPILHEY